MSALSDEVTKRLQQIDEEIVSLQKNCGSVNKKNSPLPADVHVRVSKDKGRYRYYIVTPENGPNGRYLKKSEIGLAGRLVQKEYEEKVQEFSE